MGDAGDYSEEEFAVSVGNPNAYSTSAQCLAIEAVSRVQCLGGGLDASSVHAARALSEWHRSEDSPSLQRLQNPAREPPTADDAVSDSELELRRVQEVSVGALQVSEKREASTAERRAPAAAARGASRAPAAAA